MANKLSPKRRSVRRKSARKASPKRRSMRRKSARKASPKRRSSKRRSVRRKSARKASPKRRRYQRGGNSQKGGSNVEEIKNKLLDIINNDLNQLSLKINEVLKK
jgi:hypothetical protein